jgi:hypothetical protein
MATWKELDVVVDNESWRTRGVPVPHALTHLAQNNPMRLCFEDAMVFLALWTRPPMQHGFSLSDIWAWLRYFPAVTGDDELRLREEWTAVDPYHKTVLSGDFGVGFTTLALTQTLDLVHFADTFHFVNVLAPGRFRLGRTAKRGPQKSPDYIAMDVRGRYHVLECKGSQTSRASLQNSMRRGVDQKRNLGAGNAPVTYSLVAGLYVPQWESRERALLQVMDPDWTEFELILGEYTEDEIATSFGRIGFAKELAMLGWSTTANALSNATAERIEVHRAIDQDLLRTSGDEMRSSVDYIFPESVPLREESVAGVRFSATWRTQDFAQLVQGREDVIDMGRAFREGIAEGHWHLAVARERFRSELQSPIGVTYAVEYLG